MPVADADADADRDSDARNGHADRDRVARSRSRRPPCSPHPLRHPPPTLQPPPAATRSTFTLSASGKRAIRVKARCPRACAVSATLTVDATTARKLALGKSRSVGSLKRTFKAGSTTFTVKLGARVRLTKVTRFKATLTVRSGSVVERRRVTISR